MTNTSIFKKRFGSKLVEDRALAAIVDSSEDAIFAKSLDGVILSWNKGAERIYGYTAQEVIGKNVSLLTFPDTADEIPKILSRLSNGESIDHFETIRRRKDGKSIHVSLTISPIRNEEGIVVAASTIARDTSDRFRLSHFRDLLASIVDTSHDAILSKDLEGYILTWNQGAQRLYGYTEEDIIGKHVSILVPPGHPEEIPEIMKKLRSGEKINYYETIRQTKYGQLINVSLSISPIVNSSGKIIGASAIARDITAQKREQEEKARLMKDLEESLSQKNLLLQEVYHRVKNNLQVVSSLLDLGSRYVAADPKRAAGVFKESIQRIRAMALVHEKLYKAGDLERLNLSEYLKSLLDQLIRTYVTNKKMNFDLEGDCAEVDLNSGVALGLIFNELVTNSLKYAYPDSEKGKILIHCKLEEDSLILHYSDYGVGLPDGVDISTSETFGFRIVKLLTAQLNGTIQLHENQGTSFEIKIPRTDKG